MAETIPLIDTSIFIEALNGNKQLGDFLYNSDLFYYSFVTRKELFKKKGLSNSNKKTIKQLLSLGTIFFLDPAILECMRFIAPLFHKKNIKDTNDIIIAATAISKNLPLATLNRKHFSFIKGLKLFWMCEYKTQGILHSQ